ncbi:MAG: hypothetical protein JO331_01100, partial [Verrucomicrobia bacterium]|nr:hypothetical protein [Verrucomicrobiota bacterium]
NLHLHIITPLAFVTSRSGPSYYGYGDTELGVKYRFIKQGNYTPDVGVFPTMEVPTGNESRGLGAGHVQAYFPIWLQKDFGKWTTYGGGGFWLNPGVNNKDWGFVGWLLQRQITDHFALGAEVFHETPKVVGGESNTFVNGGGILDLSDTMHILVSVGDSIQGPRSYIGYFALQLTLGPKEKQGK